MELYTNNRGLLYKLARRYAHVDNAVDTDDLVQAGYLGLVEAARTYDASKGAWTTWAWNYVRKAMLAAVGLRGTRRRAHMGAVALDAPISEDGTTRAALLADTSLPDASSGIVEVERRAAVRGAVGRLTGRRREVIQLRDLKGMSYAAVGEALGLTPDAAWKLRRKALNELRIDPVLRREVTIDG